MTKDEQWLLDEKYGGEKTEVFFTDLGRLEAGEPLAYVIGHVPFLNCKIYLDSHPLIPRPETEFWTERAIKEIEQTFQSNERFVDRSIRVLDLCAGSGAIGVAVAKALPFVHITFAELNEVHLPTIGKNLAENAISCERYQVWQSDLFANISGQFDFVLSNPPYIDPRLDRTEPSVKNHEPVMALYGGEDGMEFLVAIIGGVQPFLKPFGQLWLEHEPEQVTAITELAARNNLKVTTHTDQYEVPRYSIIAMAQ